MPMGPGTYGSKVGRPRTSYKKGGLVVAKKAKTTTKKKPERKKEPAGLWANIRAKRRRIMAGSGESMRTKGSPGAPTEKELEKSQTT